MLQIFQISYDSKFHLHYWDRIAELFLKNTVITYIESILKVQHGYLSDYSTQRVERNIYETRNIFWRCYYFQQLIYTADKTICI